LALWSADSVQSAWVRDEAAFGRDAGKLIPFSLDGTAPPLGFRGFQSIDLSKWRHGQPPAPERISRAIERLSGRPASAAPTTQPQDGDRRGKGGFFARPMVLAAVAFVLALAFVGMLLWKQSTVANGITIDVSASPTSPDRTTAADYANAAAADMAAFLPTHFDHATVRGPVDAAGRASGYRMLVSTARPGNGAHASLTLSDSDGQTIIWSKSWNVPDASAIDLRQEVSRLASQAALCLTEAKGGSERLDQPALGLFISGCVGIDDSETSAPQLLAMFEPVVKLAPNFPQAWAYLAVVRSSFASDQKADGGPPYAAAVKSARQAIAVARELNPHSGLPYFGEAVLVEDDYLRRLALLDKGVETDPDNALLQAERGDALLNVGRMAGSVDAAHRATELDPLSPFARSRYILALAYAGDFSRAQADIGDARKKWPNDRAIDQAEYSFQYRYGDPKRADQLMSRVLENSDAVMAPNRKLIAARIEPSPAKIDDAIQAFRARVQFDGGHGIKLLLALGTFGRVEEIYQLLSDPKFLSFIEPNLLFRPEFAGVRADPRFMPVAARLGLVRYWRGSGNWPDFCSGEQLRYDCKAEAAKYH
jgi:tetratricopeptide (TPR) repeat protein